MLDSERTFKIKLRLLGTVFEILLTSAIICIEVRLPNIFKIINITNLAKVIQESSFIKRSFYKLYPNRKH